jgi:hypothetical protein
LELTVKLGVADADPNFRETRAIALAGVGRRDEAIAELDRAIESSSTAGVPSNARKFGRLRSILTGPRPFSEPWPFAEDGPDPSPGPVPTE